jgi:hypothetical protein
MKVLSCVTCLVTCVTVGYASRLGMRHVLACVTFGMRHVVACVMRFGMRHVLACVTLWHASCVLACVTFRDASRFVMRHVFSCVPGVEWVGREEEAERSHH